MSTATHSEKNAALPLRGEANPMPLPVFIVALVGFSIFQASILMADIGSPFNVSRLTIPALFVEGALFVLVAGLSYVDRMISPRSVLGLSFLFVIPSILAFLGIGALSPALGFFLRICSNAGSAALMICWITVFMSMGMVRAGLGVIATFGCSFAIVYLEQNFHLIQAIPTELALYLISYLALIVTIVSIGRGGHVADFCVADVPMRYSYEKIGRAIAGAALFSAIYGFVSQTDYLANFPIYQQTPEVVLIAFLAVVASAAWYFISERSFDTDSVFPYMAVLFASVLFYRCTNQYNYNFAVALMTALLLYYFMILWVIFLREAYKRKLPALFLLCLALGASRIALALGRMVSIWAYTSSLPISMQSISVVFIGIIWLLLVCMALHFAGYAHSRNKRDLYALQEQREDQRELVFAPEQNEEEGFERSFFEMTAQCGLSERERQIIHEFALGKTSRVIAEELILSEHTIRAHIRNAYKKLGINSKQELIALLRNE